MNRPATTKIEEKRGRFGLISLFVLGMIAVAISAGLDARNRSILETMTEPTAVGDELGLGSDPRQNPTGEVLRWNRRPYFLDGNESVKLREADVLKLSRDDTGKINIYRQEKEAKESNLVLVKIAPGEFLKLEPK
jgi:hypothetical protein